MTPTPELERILDALAACIGLDTAEHLGTSNTVPYLDRAAAAKVLEPLVWHTGTPPVKGQSLEHYWIAKRSKRGDVYYGGAFYANGYIAPIADDCDETPSCASPVSGGDGDFYWTGWFQDFDDDKFTPVEGEVIAWIRPIIDAARATPARRTQQSTKE